MREQKFIVGGEWKTGDAQSSVRNPHNNSEIARVHLADGNDIEEALRCAGEGFITVSKYSSSERAEILKSVVSQVRSRKEEFAQLITAEAGKPVSFSRIEVERAVATFEIAAEETKRIYGETIPLDITHGIKGRYGIVNHFPIGIILCISPFNFPLNLVAHKIAPAIATGNSFILKPPPQTPLTSLALGEILINAGLEKRAINILPTSNVLAETMVTDDRIAMLSFTGSAKVGWQLKAKAGKKKILLELGGNAAVIVDPTADMSHAVSRCILGGYGYSGQVCIKVQRILVHDSLFREFTKQFIESVKKVACGDPVDEKTMVGPMISEQEAKRVEAWVNEAVNEGATLLAGGKRDGNIFFPTLLTDITPSMKVCSEEVFGPVVTLERYSTIEKAVEIANNSKYGLQAGIFSNDHAAIQYAYKHLHVGGVIVNDYPTFRVDSMPYGGVKDSGTGREGIRYAMDEMMERKLLVV